MKLYKVLGDNHSCSGGNFNWTPYLPTDGKPGEWTPKKRSVSMCKSGYHGTTAEHLLYFMDGNQLWEVETEGITWDDEHQKFVARRMRLIRQIETWNDKTLRLFACWCARQVWDLLPDERSRNAVEVAERYANGEATNEELSAARDAARDAAWAAARDAARDAARAAAWAAARDAATDAEYKWQSRHLCEVLGLSTVESEGK